MCGYRKVRGSYLGTVNHCSSIRLPAMGSGAVPLLVLVLELGVVTGAEGGARYWTTREQGRQKTWSRLGCIVGVRGSWRREMVPRPGQASLQGQGGLPSTGLDTQD